MDKFVHRVLMGIAAGVGAYTVLTAGYRVAVAVAERRAAAREAAREDAEEAPAA